VNIKHVTAGAVELYQNIEFKITNTLSILCKSESRDTCDSQVATLHASHVLS
jgi:hypothetical protein